MADHMQAINTLVAMQVKDIREERDALAHALKNMTANFRASLILVSDNETRALGMDIVRDAERLLKRIGK